MQAGVLVARVAKDVEVPVGNGLERLFGGRASPRRRPETSEGTTTGRRGCHKYARGRHPQGSGGDRGDADYGAVSSGSGQSGDQRCGRG